MKTEELVEIWKNPELRMKNNVTHPAGKSFVEMNEMEMSDICGGAVEYQPMTTPFCAASVSAVVSFVGSYLVTAVYCKD